jgi:hypothetical protein
MKQAVAVATIPRPRVWSEVRALLETPQRLEEESETDQNETGVSSIATDPKSGLAGLRKRYPTRGSVRM